MLGLLPSIPQRRKYKVVPLAEEVWRHRARSSASFLIFKIAFLWGGSFGLALAICILILCVFLNIISIDINDINTYSNTHIYINVRVCVYNSFAITPRISRRSVSCGPLQVEMEYQKWEICQVHSKSPFLGVFNCCLHSCRVWSACRVFFYWHAQSPWLTKLQANEHMASLDSDLFFQPWRLAKKSGLFVGHCLGAGKQIGGSCAKWIFLRCRPCQDSGRSSCLVILAYLLWAPRLLERPQMLTWFTYHDHDPRKSLCGTMWIQHECYKIKIRRIYAICLLCPVIFLKRNLMHDDRVRFLGDYHELWFFSHIGLASSPTTAFRISIGLLSYPVPRFSASPMQRLRSSAGVMWHLGCQQCLPITSDHWDEGWENPTQHDAMMLPGRGDLYLAGIDLLIRGWLGHLFSGRPATRSLTFWA